MMAPACSAALPTIGRRMMLMKLTEMLHDSAAACANADDRGRKKNEQVTRKGYEGTDISFTVVLSPSALE